MPHKKFLEVRLKAMRALMAAQDLDAFIVMDRVNTCYFTDFHASYSILIIDGDDQIFITDSRYAEMAEREVEGFDVRVQPRLNVKDWLKDLWKKRGYSRAGFEGSISVNDRDDLGKWTRGTRLVKAGHLAEQLRRVKDDVEIKKIRGAVRAADKLMEYAVDYAAVGLAEIALSKAIRRGAEELGQGESFTNIVASGPNSSRPHHRPGKRRIRQGDPLTIDLGVVVEGYCSDLTRTFSIGKPSAEWEKMYEVCLQANVAAINALQPGMTGKEVDAVAREVISLAGYGEYFGHGLGHGVGLEIHESPRLSPSAGKYRLEPGNVVTIEPGIYIPGKGGVRIEDYVLLTEKGAQVLSKSPKNLTILAG